jgi:hypothetical protein
MLGLDKLLICNVLFILHPAAGQFKLQMSSCAKTKGKTAPDAAVLPDLKIFDGR